MSHRVHSAQHKRRMRLRRIEQAARVANWREPGQLAVDRTAYCAWLRLQNVRNGVGSSKQRIAFQKRNSA